jgi:hypothetical protein
MTKMKTYSYYQSLLLKPIVEDYQPFKRINIDVNQMSAETPDYTKIAALIAPERHLCIKCKTHIARIGIVCDDCLVPSMPENKEAPIHTNSNTTAPSGNS